MNLSDYVGLPWALGGRSRDACDCYGILCLAYRDILGIQLPEYDEHYVTAADRESISTLIKGELGPWRSVTAGFERTMDAVVMTEAGFPIHIGVVASPGYVLHMPPGRDSVVEPYRFGKLRLRIAGFYRHEQVL